MAVLAFVILLSMLIIPRMAGYLAYEKPLQPADAMVVLMGSVADRALGAWELYEDGYAPEILMVASWQRGADYLEPYGVSVPNNSDLTAQALVELGVPGEQIRVLPGGAISTADEAEVIREFLETNPQIGSVILVSSEFHLRRAAMIFRREFRNMDREVELIPRPSRYSELETTGWYRDRESAKTVFFEYAKLGGELLGL